MVVSPWAKVYVDGRSLGPSPIKGLVLTAGRHRVRLVNSSLGRAERITVTIRSGRTTRVTRHWD